MSHSSFTSSARSPGPESSPCPAGARILDAVEAAGGATDEADLQRINLAAGLSDGAQIRLPKIGENTESLPLVVGGDSGGLEGDGPGSGLVNINLASAAEMEALLGVGPALAAAIVEHREKNGPFASAESLLDVRGIGPAKLEAMIEQVAVR